MRVWTLLRLEWHQYINVIQNGVNWSTSRHIFLETSFCSLYQVRIQFHENLDCTDFQACQKILTAFYLQTKKRH